CCAASKGSITGSRTRCRRGRPPRRSPTAESGLSLVEPRGVGGPERKRAVRPRDAASLILLRGEGKTLEVLAGRRPLHLRFMRGVYVCGGGAIDPPDRVAWAIEAGTATLGPRLARSARAAMRETWEEAGVLLGQPAGPVSVPSIRTPIERAYLERRLVAAMD